MTEFDAVVFDIGETLLDRTREYAAWADFFGVPAHTFSAVFGAMIARGATVAEVLESFDRRDGEHSDSDSDSDSPRSVFERRVDAGAAIRLDERDLYPDAARTIRALKARGLVVGIAGNQPAAVSEQLRELDLGADFIGSSTEWGVAKPRPEFFERVAREAGTTPARTVYVGDQVDNDVRAPQRAGLASVRILRGPWGYLTRDAEAEAGCLAVIRSLDELVPLLGAATGTIPATWTEQNHRQPK